MSGNGGRQQIVTSGGNNNMMAMLMVLMQGNGAGRQDAGAGSNNLAAMMAMMSSQLTQQNAGGVSSPVVPVSPTPASASAVPATPAAAAPAVPAIPAAAAPAPAMARVARSMTLPQADIPTLSLDFWGTRVDVSLPPAEDLLYFSSYYQDFMVLGGAQPAMSIRLSTPDGAPYIRSDSRQVERLEDGAWLADTDGDGGLRPFPLPPFARAPLCDVVTTLHASAASHPASPYSTLIMHGDTTAGKSVLLLALLQRGWHFVADDTLVIDRAARILRYAAPIGVRENTQVLLPWLSALLPEYAPRYETPTGITTVVHPNDLPFRKAPLMTHATWGVMLVRGSTFAVEERGPNLRVITLDIARDLEQAIEVLTAWTAALPQGEADAPEAG